MSPVIPYLEQSHREWEKTEVLAGFVEFLQKGNSIRETGHALAKSEVRDLFLPLRDPFDHGV